MYTSLDGRRVNSASSNDSEQTSNKVRRYGFALLAVVLFMWLITRGGGSTPAKSASTVTTRNSNHARDDVDDDDLLDNDAVDEDETEETFKKWRTQGAAEEDESYGEDFSQPDKDEEQTKPLQKQEETSKKKPKADVIETDDYQGYGDVEDMDEFSTDDSYGDEDDVPEKKSPPTFKPTAAKTPKPTALKPATTASPTHKSSQDATDEDDEEQKQRERDEESFKDDGEDTFVGSSKKSSPSIVVPQDCESAVRVDFKTKNKKVHLIEIARSGGAPVAAAFREWARRHGPRLRVFRAAENVTSICPRATFASSIIIGHGYGFCPDMDVSKLFTITVLRGPIPRVTSFLDTTAADIFQEDKAKLVVSTYGKMFMSDLIHAYNATAEIEPGEKLIRGWATQQSRYLCGYECAGPNAKITDEKVILARALANLRKIDAIGFIDDMKLVPQLKFFLPTLVPHGYTHFAKEKEKAHKNLLDERARTIINEWAALDKVLLDEAKIIVEKRTNFAIKCFPDSSSP